ncbi:hypothetical protein E9549_14385 [Blastococcus sp. MG754426]|uniref:hypothetical protein n=1 Tax=unclassified Blastococcus TaxID=2619396 RepID=UPI001EEF8F11|nr:MULTISPECIES: hypothetical protein [unclassified Blastococcus]MCF6508584.1 hypothetical protein [Blastococcus sp. MG754426]MCF6513162.1 hypothetical protein [Blastococcus sp. MG754427]
MSGPAARWTRRAAALGALVALLLVGLPGTAAAAAGAEGYAADRVVVVGVPGLTWADVDPAATPQLWSLAGESAIGATSVRAARSTTCVLDGWATLGAGNRARFPGTDEGLPPVPLPTLPDPEAPGAEEEAAPDGEAPEGPRMDTSLTRCGLQERVAEVALGDPQATVARIAEDEGTVRFGAEPGALGAAVGCATVSGRAAALAVAADGVLLTTVPTLPAEPAELAGLLTGCPLTLVSLDRLADAGAPGAEPTDDGTRPQPRAAALTRIDDVLGRLRAALDTLPGETLLLLAGISEVNDGRPQLHVGMAAGPGFDVGWLTSASTGRVPFVQLIDVAPTVLRALGLDPPASMNGQPWRSTGERPPLAQAVDELELVNVAATTHHRNTGVFFWTFVVVGATVVGLGVLVVGSGRRGARPGTWPPARRALRLLCLAAAGLPVATYLAGAVPWERADAPLAALLTAVVVADVAVLAVAALGPWRRRRLGPALAVLAITLLTLVGDVLSGSPLELNGPLGYDAVVAGRFTGYGNLTFGLLSVSALTVTAAVAAAVGRRSPEGRARRRTAAVVLAAGLLTVAVIGAPPLGRDFGGVLAALPGFLLLAMLLARVRVTAVRLGAILAAAVVAVSSVAVLDWLRAPTDRTHLGRFVEQVLTGEAWTVISRKAQANIGILLGSPLAWMLPVALVAAVWLLRPGGPLRSVPPGPGRAPRGPAGLPLADAAVLRAALLAVALSLTIGALVNDSGVALPATAAALLVPLLVWLAAGPEPGPTGPGESVGGAPHSGRAAGPDRVTVVSRGSTVGNT